jgi:hypothetical protein
MAENRNRTTFYESRLHKINKVCMSNGLDASTRSETDIQTNRDGLCIWRLFLFLNVS